MSGGGAHHVHHAHLLVHHHHLLDLMLLLEAIRVSRPGGGQTEETRGRVEGEEEGGTAGVICARSSGFACNRCCAENVFSHAKEIKNHSHVALRLNGGYLHQGEGGGHVRDDSLELVQVLGCRLGQLHPYEF